MFLTGFDFISTVFWESTLGFKTASNTSRFKWFCPKDSDYRYFSNMLQKPCHTHPRWRIQQIKYLVNTVSYCYGCYWSPRHYKGNGLKDRLMLQCLLLRIWFWQIQTKMGFLLLLWAWITLWLHLERQPSTV